jgi:hypothetical protein
MSGAASIEVSNEELVTIRDAMRTMPALLSALERGEQEKFVLMRHGKMRAVLVTVGEYEALCE